MFDNDEEKAKLVHFGVLGMKWGRRMNRNLADSYANSAANLRKHGYSKEADADQAESDAYRKKSNDLDAKIKARKQERDAKLQPEADKRRQQTKELIDELMVDAARGKKFNPEKERKYWETFFKDDLNATPDSIRKERIQNGLLVATGVLAVAGTIAANVYIERYTSGKSLPKWARP